MPARNDLRFRRSFAGNEYRKSSGQGSELGNLIGVGKQSFRPRRASRRLLARLATVHEPICARQFLVLVAGTHRASAALSVSVK